MLKLLTQRQNQDDKMNEFAFDGGGRLHSMSNAINKIYVNIKDTFSKLTSTVNVEFVNLSDDERIRFINNTEPYIYYDINML